MRPRTLAWVAEASGGTLGAPVAASATVRGVKVDSRDVKAGDLFVALPGERRDGHGFVADALMRGAGGAIVNRQWAQATTRALPEPGPLISVPDCGEALLALAEAERADLSAMVVGVTGSTGKTCTKDLTAAILSSRLRTVASRASFNNEVGLPLTILSGDGDTEALVCEMGSRGQGHLRLLCRVARPAIGVVTNVGVAHMELFGSAEVLREAKAELPESLPSSGTAVLNADDPIVAAYAARTAATVVLFGTVRGADVRAEQVVLDAWTGRARFRLFTPSGSAPVTLSLPGHHMVPNALAAAAVGWALDVPIASMAAALATAAVSAGRMEAFDTPEGIRVVDDAYNANPASMAAALRAGRSMAGAGRCIAVLGAMAELGPIAAEEHERVGELVARLGIDVLVVVGGDARLIAVSAQREGLEPHDIHECDGVEDAVRAIRSLAGPGDLVLIKASRVARLERVADSLRGRLQAPEGATA